MHGQLGNISSMLDDGEGALRGHSQYAVGGVVFGPSSDAEAKTSAISVDLCMRGVLIITRGMGKRRVDRVHTH